MLKINKKIMLNALIMGTFLTNSGIGTDEQDKTSNADSRTPFNSGRENFSLVEKHKCNFINSILDQQTQRSQARADIFGASMVFDMEKENESDILNFLEEANKHSKKVSLTFLNITPQTLEKILNSRYTTSLNEGKLSWSYKVPAPIIKVELQENGHHQGILTDYLDSQEKRQDIRTDLFKQRHRLDMTQERVSDVLNLLNIAARHSAKVKLSLQNITPEDLNAILRDSNAQSIQEEDLLWTYHPVALDGGQNPYQQEEDKYAPDDWDREEGQEKRPYYIDAVKKTQENMAPFIYDDREGDVLDGKDKDEGFVDKELKGQDKEKDTGYGIRDLNGLEQQNEIGEVAIQEAAQRGVDNRVERENGVERPNGYKRFSNPLKVKSSRGLWAPTLDALRDGTSKKGTASLTMPLKAWGVTNPVIVTELNPIPVARIGFTPRSNLTNLNQSDSENKDASAPHSSRNLVKIFCRQGTGEGRAQS